MQRDAPQGAGPAEWAEWYEQYLTRAAGHSARMAELYQDVMARVSRGDLPATVINDSLPAHLRALVELCFALLNGLNDTQTRSAEEYLAGVLGTAARASEPALFALDLSAPLGESTSASLSIANTRDETSVVRCSITDVRRSD